MTIQEHERLKYYQFDLFESHRLDQGIFSRHGGVSPAPWASLNTGGMNGDARENVIENRRRIFAEFERPVESIFDVWQVHSADVIVGHAARPLDAPHQKADAIITNRSDVSLFMRFGDCVPIYFFDPLCKVIGMAHAGWQGTASKIVCKTVECMRQVYGCQPVNILAGIGPSICVDHYEFEGPALETVHTAFEQESSEVLLRKDGKMHFDLWQANRMLLLQAGLLEPHIQVSGICTAGHIEDWFSHRGEFGQTGRFGALLALKLDHE